MRAAHNVWICVIVSACGPAGQLNQETPATKVVDAASNGQTQEDAALGLAGLGDHRCELTYQLVRVVQGRSSASSFYEANSGDLVSQQGILQSDHGDTCVSYCAAELQALRAKNGKNQVLFRNCAFNRDVKSAYVKGWVTSYSNGVVSGWACKYGQEEAVSIDFYAGGLAGTGTLLGRAIANQVPTVGTFSRELYFRDLMNGFFSPILADNLLRTGADQALTGKTGNDQALIGKECGTKVASHKFSFVVPESLRSQHSGKAIFAHALDRADSTRNFAIGNSGSIMLPLPYSLASLDGGNFVELTPKDLLPIASAPEVNSSLGCESTNKICLMHSKKLNLLVTQTGVSLQGPPQTTVSYDAAQSACRNLRLPSRLVSNGSGSSQTSGTEDGRGWRLPNPSEMDSIDELKRLTANSAIRAKFESGSATLWAEVPTNQMNLNEVGNVIANGITNRITQAFGDGTASFLCVKSISSGSTTAVPSAVSTAVPSAVSTAVPSAVSTAVPSVVSTAVPSAVSTAVPSAVSTAVPSAVSTAVPSAVSTAVPSAVLTTLAQGILNGLSNTLATGTPAPLPPDGALAQKLEAQFNDKFKVMIDKSCAQCHELRYSSFSRLKSQAGLLRYRMEGPSHLPISRLSSAEFNELRSFLSELAKLP